MAQIYIQTLIDLLKESIGIEAAEKIVYEAVKEAGLSIKTGYTDEEFTKICDILKNRGGFIKIIATVVSTSAYTNIYYQKELVKERKEKEDLARLNETLEQKVEERTRQLRETQAEILQSAKMAAVGQLGAGVAHELNNPLGGILGYAQFILEKLRRPEFGAEDFKGCSRYIESIEREAARCKGIVENLLKFSRRPIVANPEPLNIAQVIDETLSIIGHQLKLKNINVITDITPDLAKVTGIINQLQQVFTNVILNTQQAMPEGGELKITAQNLLHEKTQSPIKVRLEFADNGCGISEENLKHMFGPFFTTKQKEKGIGLGLAVSYQIIQDHKGTIDLKSQAGKGTTVTINLPAISK